MLTFLQRTILFDPSGCLTPHENTAVTLTRWARQGQIQVCSHILAVGLGDILQRRKTRKYVPGGAKYQNKTEQRSLSH